MTLGPSQQEIFELVCEKGEKGITVEEMQKIIRKRNLRLSTSRSTLNKVLRELRDEKGVIRSKLVLGGGSWRNRYYPKSTTKEGQ